MVDVSGALGERGIFTTRFYSLWVLFCSLKHREVTLSHGDSGCPFPLLSSILIPLLSHEPRERLRPSRRKERQKDVPEVDLQL